MDFNVYLDKIGLWEEGRAAFWDIHKKLSEKGFQNIMNDAFFAYDEGDNAFEDFLKTLVAKFGYPIETLTIYFYIRISERTYKNYKKLGITDEIFYSSMDDFATSARQGVDRIGVYGIPRSPDRPWQRLILDMKIFRLGRLQFELYKSPCDAKFDGIEILKDEPCINVHIPGYAPLQEDACEESYELARQFFRKHFGMERCVFVCHSWLLAPWLSEVLSENSGILRFQSKYKIVETSEDAFDTILYVFAKKQENPKNYPEDTTLRKLVKERLLKSEPLQMSLGFRI